MEDLSQRLRLLRKERGMTQKQMAELLHQTLRAYQYCESGQHVPEYWNLIALADFFEVSLDYLTGRSETRERQL